MAQPHTQTLRRDGQLLPWLRNALSLKRSKSRVLLLTAGLLVLFCTYTVTTKRQDGGLPLRQTRLADAYKPPRYSSPEQAKARLNVSQVYVLSGSQSRAANMQRMLSYAQVPYQLVRGPDPYIRWINKTVNDSALSDAFNSTHNAQKLPDYYRFSLACALGHRKIYRDAQENGYEKILILEDDIDIDSKLFDRMDRVWSELPADWDILMLGYAAPKPAQQWYEPDAEKDVDRMYWASQTHAYIVNCKALPTILEATQDIDTAPIDTILMSYLSGSGALKLYGVRPPLALQLNRITSLLSGGEASEWGRGDFGSDGFAYLSGAWQGGDGGRPWRPAAD